MGIYFKPLRRKVGIVTLVVACVCMFSWVRSYYERDMLWPFKFNHSSDYSFWSHEDGFQLYEYEIVDPDDLLGVRMVPILTIPHWSVVIPLTFLSAWLLLSKPRAKASADSSHGISK